MNKYEKKQTVNLGCRNIKDFPGGSVVKNPPAMQEQQETQFRSMHPEDPLEEGMASHSSILAWRIPWTGEPGGLWSIGFQRVGHGSNDLEHGYIKWNLKKKYSERILSSDPISTANKL